MRADLQQFTKLFDRIAHSHSYNHVFTDFLDIVICCLSNQQYEDEYLSIIKKYKPEQTLIFSELFAEMIIQMDNNGTGCADLLGEFFQLNP